MGTINILVLSDIEAAGEWIATQALISKMKKERPEMNFFLVAYGRETMFLEKKIFKKIVLLNKPHLFPPFRYYRQILVELVNGIRKINALKKIGSKFDLVISTEYSLFLSSKFALPFCESIFYFHGIRHFYSLSFNHFNFYLFLRKALERFAWVLSDKIVAPSKPAQKILESELGIFAKLKNFFVIPNLVRDNFFKKHRQKEIDNFKIRIGLSQNKKVILYVGRIAEKKGLENLIKAFALLKTKDIFLIIAYPSFNIDYKVFDRIKFLIKSDHLDKSVFFIKNAHRDHLPLLYRVADCAILPSELETASLFILEAIYCQLPIFSTKSGDAGSLLNKVDQFLLLKDGSLQTIRKTIELFYEKPKTWLVTIKFKMAEIAKNYPSKRYVREFLKLMD